MVRRAARALGRLAGMAIAWQRRLVKLSEKLDPALLGGLVIRVGDTVFDGSVRTRLRRIREQLLQRSTHEIQSRRDQFSLTT
jgi:F0F1-type ATP synthase delta subunit